jgi:putative transcriptional regulator
MKRLNLTDHFLIAMPTMEDPYFSKSLIYIAEHNEQGALGIIVNRPINMTLATLFDKIDEPLKSAELANLPIFFGGPVQTDRGFVLHRPLGAWTSSRDVLQAVARDGEPHQIMISLGYSGWGAGQLEGELAQNAWLTVPAEPFILFDLPCEERLPSAMEMLGIDFIHLTGQAGHA